MRLLLSVLGFLFSVGFVGQIQNVWELDNFRAEFPVGDGVYNEVWGFVQDGEEYAVIGAMHGTFFFHITDDDKLEQVAYKEGYFSFNKYKVF